MEKLVKATSYSKRIKELRVIARIEIGHPVLVRDAVAKRLATVADNLPKGLFLQIDSGYRSIKTQNDLWIYRSKTIRGLVADPTKKSPLHNTGGAVDVALQTEKSKEINLSAPFAKYYTYPELRSKKITPDAQEKRLLLNKLMLEAGFAPNPKEYWHFSYGDKAWADYYKKEVLCQGIESVDRKLQYSFPRVVFNKMIKRVWRLIRLMFGLKVNY